ncbi:MAG: tape measure protein [Thermogutta sp.]|uniref:tape measure protein n=1 Tax=Thermogutta sp. TaxID=1962930 RepID=UPI0019CB1E11|nr:tape measure protein [Thermogutta sp.]MBC7350855.1 tape measure protein [Thermogutta sp.]
MGISIGMGIASSIGSAIRSAVGLATQMETLSTSFEVLLGSSSKAKQMMEEINKFAAATPFEQMELADVAKQLLAYGTAAENIIPTMRQLGDIAALSGANLGDLAAIYGKIQQGGRLTTETLESFQSRGIPITRELANVFGVAESQVRELVSEGKVGFAEVQQALNRLTGEGGQFAGGMERLSKTTAGLWSTVTGNFKTALGEIGGMLIAVFNVKGILAWAGDTLARIGEWAAGVRQWISFVYENWDIAWGIIYERVNLALSNAWAYIEAFGNNIGILVRWLLDNWRAVFTDIYNFTTTTVTNLFNNLTRLWNAFWTFIKTGRWEFRWRPLTEGFKSSIKQWPQFVSAAVKDSTPELDRLTRLWNDKWRKATSQVAEAGKEAAGKVPEEESPEVPEAEPLEIPEVASPEKVAAPVAAVAGVGGGAGTGAVGQAMSGFYGFAQLASEMQRRALDEMQKRQVELAQKTAEAVQKLATAAEGGALKVKVDQPIVATYG